MKKPQISIIMIHDSTADRLKSSLVSIYEQVYSDFEVVAADITPGNRCLSWVQAAFGDKDNLIYLKSDTPVSRTAAFNWAVETASAPYVAFLESGVLWHREKLKFQMEGLSSAGDNAVWIYADAREQGNAGRRIPGEDVPVYKKIGSVFPDLIREDLIDFNTVLMKREAYLETGGMDEELPALAEYELLLRLALRYPVSYQNAVVAVIPKRKEAPQLTLPVECLLLQEFSTALERMGLKQEKLEQVIAFAEENNQVALMREYAEILSEETQYRTYLKGFLERTDFAPKKPEPLAESVETVAEGCVGCCGCVDVCPVQAIAMVSNEKGFLIPSVNREKCVSCGKCRQRCPALGKPSSVPWPKQCFAVQASQKDRRASSSGGIFPLLARTFLETGGYVAGAIFDRNFHVRHIVSNRPEDVQRMHTSKYVQSDTRGTYARIRELLEQGERVLFTGCPCQAAGLRTFLSKDYPGLYTAEVICHGVPSPGVFERYLREFIRENGKIAEVSFRKKSEFGWGTGLYIRFKNGRVYSNKGYEPYMAAFLNDWILRDSCYQCQFKEKKYSDIVLGDFWGIGKLDASLDDGTGTSVMTLNTQKGLELYRGIQDAFCRVKTFPLQDAAKGNPNMFASAARKKFVGLLYSNLSGARLQQAIQMTFAQSRFDIGLALWWSPNYGNALTNYALYKTLSKKYATLAIDNLCLVPGGRFRRFAQDYFLLSSDYFPAGNSRMVQDSCNAFIVGSDQTWNYHFEQMFGCGKFYQLDFVKENKRKISYAASFGMTGAEPPQEYGAYYKRFHRISVREGFGVGLCREKYGVEAVQVLDPVFLPEREEYEALAEKAKVREEEPFIMAYLLNPTPEKRDVCRKLQRLLGGIKIINVTENSPDRREIYRHILEFDHVQGDIEVEDWVYYMKNCQFVITDSFHGTCFSVIFEKRFLTFVNRQPDRFSIFQELTDTGQRILERFDNMPADDLEKYLEDLDYDKIREELAEKKKRSIAWLEEALE